MCGIAGYFAIREGAQEGVIRAMTDRLVHRGPDGSGTWIDAEVGLALGQRRLAIVDLSPAGHQPMTSACGRLVLTFNGEIYNHLELRRRLEAESPGGDWRGHSDTETLLAALRRWGIEKTLPMLNGMFAFALWDRDRRILSLARDRFGEKPLFYGTSRGTFLFGSELKALTAHHDWEGRIDPDVVALYLRHAYVPDPECIYQGMGKLPPAHWVEVEAGVPGTPRRYWSLTTAVEARRRDGSPEEHLDELETLLTEAIGIRMEADVPVGAFLSGGIDSSVVVALMQAQSARPVRSFTIGFDVPGYNEAVHAAEIAAHLGTDHTELYLSPQDARDVVPRLPGIWDEPFADSSQIPTLLLSEMTSRHVRVALSGDAGDELFAGYNRYAGGWNAYSRLSRLPGALHGPISWALSRLPAHDIDRITARLPKRLRQPAMGDKLIKLGSVLSHSEPLDFYRSLVSQIQEPLDWVLGAMQRDTLLDRPEDWPRTSDFRETMMYLDAMTYLPGDILTKVDRATMAHSLEGRVPFLDHRVAEFAWTLPLEHKLHGGQAKWHLRQILARHVPTEIFDRPKMGFGIPIEHWLSGPLRDWAEDLLSEEALARSDVFDARRVRGMWYDQLAGRRRSHHQLWAILMLQAWTSAT